MKDEEDRKDKVIEYFDKDWNKTDKSSDWIWYIDYTPQTGSAYKNGDLTIRNKEEQCWEYEKVKDPKKPELPDYLPEKAKSAIIYYVITPLEVKESF